MFTFLSDKITITHNGRVAVVNKLNRQYLSGFFGIPEENILGLCQIGTNVHYCFEKDGTCNIPSSDKFFDIVTKNLAAGESSSPTSSSSSSSSSLVPQAYPALPLLPQPLPTPVPIPMPAVAPEQVPQAVVAASAPSAISSYIEDKCRRLEKDVEQLAGLLNRAKDEYLELKNLQAAAEKRIQHFEEAVDILRRNLKEERDEKAAMKEQLTGLCCSQGCYRQRVFTSMSTNHENRTEENIWKLVQGTRQTVSIEPAEGADVLLMAHGNGKVDRKDYRLDVLVFVDEKPCGVKQDQVPMLEPASKNKAPCSFDLQTGAAQCTSKNFVPFSVCGYARLPKGTHTFDVRFRNGTHMGHVFCNDVGLAVFVC